MPRDPKTIEEAREMLLQDDKSIEQMQTELNTMREEAKKNEQTINDLRTLNQKYYLQLAQQTEEQEDKSSDDKPAESLEDFARNLKGVF